MSDHTPDHRHGSYSWLIPIATIVVVVGAVLAGLFLFNEPVPIDTIPEPPEEIPPGEVLYRQHCANCHGGSGGGVPNRYPPLVDTRWVLEDSERLILIVLHGMIGPIEVRGQVYDEYKPPLAHQLSDAEIATVLTYIRSSWGNEAPPIGEEEVARTRRAYPQPRDPWTVEALQERQPDEPVE